MFKDVPPQFVRLASGCLDQVETSGDLLQATERAWAKLESHLSGHLGQTRAQALLVLALTLARADFPVLSDLTPTADGRLPPLHTVLEQWSMAEVHAAVVGLLARTLGLVATLEGEAAADLAGRAAVGRARSRRFTRPT